jgi:2-haloacid dehalogenase
MPKAPAGRLADRRAVQAGILRDMTSEIRNVVFDIGGVLLEWDPARVYRPLIADPVELERFFAEVCTSEWNETLDAGRPFDEACDELAAQFPDQADLVQAWRRQDDMVAGEIAGTVELVARLRAAGRPLYLLTNMPSDIFRHRRERYAVLRQFDGWVVSGEEGVLKPSPEIFDVLINRYGLEPRETLFVDDAERNVVGAEAVGFMTHRFVDPPALARVLADHGLLDGS